MPTEAKKGGKKVLDNVLFLIRALMKNTGRRKNVAGIGIGTPGSVNEKGIIIGGAQNLPGWEGTEIVSRSGKSPASR